MFSPQSTCSQSVDSAPNHSVWMRDSLVNSETNGETLDETMVERATCDSSCQTCVQLISKFFDLINKSFEYSKTACQIVSVSWNLDSRSSKSTETWDHWCKRSFRGRTSPQNSTNQSAAGRYFPKLKTLLSCARCLPSHLTKQLLLLLLVKVKKILT